MPRLSKNSRCPLPPVEYGWFSRPGSVMLPPRMTNPVFAFWPRTAALALGLAACLPPATAGDPAPVPVRLEPHHHLVLENAYIRLYDVQISPGSPTLYHRHAAASVFVQLNESRSASQELGEAPTAGQLVAAGTARFAAYNEKPVTHRAFALGPKASHTLMIELLRKPAEVDLARPADRSGLQLAWEHPQVRLYRLHLRTHQTCPLPADGCAHLLIAITGPIIADPSPAPRPRELRAEEYAFFAPGTALWVQNRGDSASDCILLELP
jgi:hypothetical protein